MVEMWEDGDKNEKPEFHWEPNFVKVESDELHGEILWRRKATVNKFMMTITVQKTF